MRLKLSVLLVVVTAGLALAAVVKLRRRKRSFEITTDDLHYQEHSPEELAAHHLIDLNSASLDDFSQVGLDRKMADQIIESRPYRNKLDLLARMVIPEEVYNVIKHHIGIAGATETVKVGG